MAQYIYIYMHIFIHTVICNITRLELEFNFVRQIQDNGLRALQRFGTTSIKSFTSVFISTSKTILDVAAKMFSPVAWGGSEFSQRLPLCVSLWRLIMQI